MALRWRLLLTLTAIVAAIAGAAVYVHRQRLGWQWEAYRVGAAEAYDAARARLADATAGPEATQRIRELVGYWGRGNTRFDLFLARYLGDAQSSEALREGFSIELAWRDGLLPRWAHYWCWRAPLEPDQQIATVVDYFQLLARADPPRTITWREVLDLQAVFALSGEERLALRLSPENWRERFAKWRAARPLPVPHVARPETPLVDWQGPSPQADR
jgi:hypothetical protein